MMKETSSSGRSSRPASIRRLVLGAVLFLTGVWLCGPVVLAEDMGSPTNLPDETDTGDSGNLLSCSPSASSCSYYLYFEEKKTCGFDSYPISFGYRYCTKFLARRDRFSPEGIKWLDATALCLQEELDEFHSVPCEELTEASIDMHVKCYTENGYCNLAWKDRWKVIGITLRHIFRHPIYSFKNYRRIRRVCRAQREAGELGSSAHPLCQCT